MLRLPGDFKDITTDGLIVTGALSGVISADYFEQIEQTEPQKNLKEGSSTRFSNCGGEGTVKNIYCSNCIAIRNEWYLIFRTFHSHSQLSEFFK